PGALRSCAALRLRPLRPPGHVFRGRGLPAAPPPPARAPARHVVDEREVPATRRERSGAVLLLLPLDERLARRPLEPRLGAAPSLALVLLPRGEIDVLVGGAVEPRQDGRLHAQPALHQCVLAVPVLDQPPRVLAEVRRRRHNPTALRPP